MAKTVVGLFDSYAGARDASEALYKAGITQDDISIVSHRSIEPFGDDEDTNNDGVDNSRAAADGAGTGATVGAVAGGAAGLLAGLGLIMIPGFGAAVGVGWLVSTLTGAGLGAAAGATVGGLAGGLNSVGVPTEHAEYYAEGVRRGGTLLTARAEDNQADDVAAVLSRYGAIDIEERGQYYRSTGYSGYNPELQPFTTEEIQRDRDAYTNYRTGSTSIMG